MGMHGKHCEYSTTVYDVIAIPAAAGMFIRWKVNLPTSVGTRRKLLRRVKLGP